MTLFNNRFYVRCGAKKTTMVWKLLSPSLGMISQIGKVLRDCEMILIPWYKNHLSSIDTHWFRANFVRKKILKKSWFSAEFHVISSYLQKCILRTKPSSKMRLRSTMAITKPRVKPKLPKLSKTWVSVKKLSTFGWGRLTLMGWSLAKVASFHVPWFASQNQESSGWWTEQCSLILIHVKLLVKYEISCDIWSIFEDVNKLKFFRPTP